MFVLIDNNSGSIHTIYSAPKELGIPYQRFLNKPTVIYDGEEIELLYFMSNFLTTVSIDYMSNVTEDILDYWIRHRCCDSQEYSVQYTCYGRNKAKNTPIMLDLTFSYNARKNIRSLKGEQAETYYIHDDDHMEHSYTILNDLSGNFMTTAPSEVILKFIHRTLKFKSNIYYTLTMDGVTSLELSPLTPEEINTHIKPQWRI